LVCACLECMRECKNNRKRERAAVFTMERRRGRDIKKLKKEGRKKQHQRAALFGMSKKRGRHQKIQ